MGADPMQALPAGLGAGFTATSIAPEVLDGIREEFTGRLDEMSEEVLKKATDKADKMLKEWAVKTTRRIDAVANRIDKFDEIVAKVQAIADQHNEAIKDDFKELKKAQIKAAQKTAAIEIDI